MVSAAFSRERAGRAGGSEAAEEIKTPEWSLRFGPVGFEEWEKFVEKRCRRVGLYDIGFGEFNPPKQEHIDATYPKHSVERRVNLFKTTCQALAARLATREAENLRTTTDTGTHTAQPASLNATRAAR